LVSDYYVRSIPGSLLFSWIVSVIPCLGSEAAETKRLKHPDLAGLV
jgi:hypothetical protein